LNLFKAMVNLDLVTINLDANTIHLLVKIVFALFLLLYSIFSLLALRQVGVMNKTLETVMSVLIERLALTHFLASVGLLLAVIAFF